MAALLLLQSTHWYVAPDWVALSVLPDKVTELFNEHKVMLKHGDLLIQPSGKLAVNWYAPFSEGDILAVVAITELVCEQFTHS